MKKLTALFQIAIGIGMIAVWILLYFSGQIPELNTEPLRILTHICAEVLTGFLLLGSGLWLIVKKQPHKLFFNFSFGCLFYTLIASPGYYAQDGEWGVFIVFMIMLTASIGLLWASTKWNNDITGKD